MVTVIITTYKRAEYLNRAINSVLNQTYQDFEIIVVDDNDPDTEDRRKLEKLMENYKSNNKVKYIQHEKNKNGAAARNTGIKEAKGEYIAFLDDDDYYLPERLEILTNKLENDKNYDAVYSGVIIKENDKIIEKVECKKTGDLQKELLMQQNVLGTGSNLFVRKSVVKELNGFDERFIRHQDVEFLIRYFRKHKILAVERVLVIKSHESRINMPNLEKFNNVKKLFFETFEEDIKKYDINTQNQIYYNNYYELLNISIKNKDYKNYKKYLDIIKKYKKINYKDKLKIYYKILNNYIKIEAVRKIITCLKCKKYYKEIV